MTRTHYLILAILAALCFTGCAQYKIRGGISYTNGEETVDVTTDGKSVRVHGGIDLDGNNVGASVDLPLPRKNKGFAK